MNQPHEYERFAARFWRPDAFNPSDAWRVLTGESKPQPTRHCFRRRSIIAIAIGVQLAIALLLLYTL